MYTINFHDASYFKNLWKLIQNVCFPKTGAYFLLIPRNCKRQMLRLSMKKKRHQEAVGLLRQPVSVESKRDHLRTGWQEWFVALILQQLLSETVSGFIFWINCCSELVCYKATACVEKLGIMCKFCIQILYYILVRSFAICNLSYYQIFIRDIKQVFVFKERRLSCFLLANSGALSQNLRFKTKVCSLPTPMPC